MFDYRYAYLLTNLFLVIPTWLFFYRKRSDLRHKILTSSIFGGIAGPLSEIIYLKDYWRPELFNGWAIGLEDFLFGFGIAGVACAAYEEMFGQKYTRRHKRRQHWILLILPIIVILLYEFNLAFPHLWINSIYISMIAFLITAAIIIYFRRDLGLDSLMSGILFGSFFLIGYLILLRFYPEIFTRWWLLKNISGITVFTIPIEELLWAFGFGMFAGPIYEFYAGLTFKKK